MGREAPPTSASAPSPPLPPRVPPLSREEGGDAEPSPGKEGDCSARTPPPRPVLLAPRGGSFQEELRARPHHRANGHVK